MLYQELWAVLRIDLLQSQTRLLPRLDCNRDFCKKFGSGCRELRKQRSPDSCS